MDHKDKLEFPTARLLPPMTPILAPDEVVLNKLDNRIPPVMAVSEPANKLIMDHVNQVKQRLGPAILADLVMMSSPAASPVFASSVMTSAVVNRKRKILSAADCSKVIADMAKVKMTVTTKGKFSSGVCPD